MRLRRLEFAVIGITLAFACFMGGFFTGRSWSAVNITSATTHVEDSSGIGITITRPESTTIEPSAQNIQEKNTSNNIDNNIIGGEQNPPLVPENSQPSEATGAPKGGDGKININLATQSELTGLPGIGGVLASRIVDYRRQYGDFSRIEDIRNVSGIGEKRYEAIQDKITVG